MDEITKSPADVSWQRRNESLVMKMKVGSWSNAELTFPRSQVEEIRRVTEIFLSGGDPNSTVSERPLWATK